VSSIITRPIVRRYLIATGQSADELRAFDALPTPTPYPEEPDYDDGLYAFLGEFSSIDRAVLGMLAAAEMLRASFDSNWAPGENESVERWVRNEIRGLILAAGVDPKAWEAAR